MEGIEDIEDISTNEIEKIETTIEWLCGVKPSETKPCSRTKPRQTSFLQRIKQKLGIEKNDLSTAEEIQEEALRRRKQGLTGSMLAPINMMDFGGQSTFYSTHQSFFTYRGIYILVVNGSKDLDEEIETEMFIPGRYGKQSTRGIHETELGILCISFTHY